MDENAPLFIKLDEHKDILNIVTVIKKKVQESKNTLGRIENLRAEEKNELENWTKNLNDVHTKVELIDRMFTNPKF
ncbi:hypothetical protein GOV08_03060 [Candidatus Woesearchaeota archaeon]|nr:hypothetical protein [Candidatus Woesearchaeota archaeon]